MVAVVRVPHMLVFCCLLMTRLIINVEISWRVECSFLVLYLVLQRLLTKEYVQKLIQRYNDDIIVKNSTLIIKKITGWLIFLCSVAFSFELLRQNGPENTAFWCFGISKSLQITRNEMKMCLYQNKGDQRVYVDRSIDICGCFFKRTKPMTQGDGGIIFISGDKF